MLKIASWNVNSIRARMEAVLPWLEEHQPDILALQETKVENHQFPVAEFESAGYHIIFHGQKSYNGVAILSKQPLSDILTQWPSEQENDPQCRLLAATLGDVRVVNVYVPNGQDLTSEKYTYKLEWLKRFRDFVSEELVRYPKMVLLGDFNIAPCDEDVYDPKVWKDCVLVSEPERHALQRLFNLGFKDSFRLFNQPKEKYSWWHYRAMAFRRNMGLRIDLILLSASLANDCEQSEIDKTPRGWDKPSDHAPVWVKLSYE